MENTPKHPEQEENEVFFTNARAFEWEEIPYKSKRRGTQAYTISGQPIPARLGIFPVFVNKEEYEK